MCFEDKNNYTKIVNGDKIDSNMTDIEVNFDTDLVDEMAVLGEDE